MFKLETQLERKISRKYAILIHFTTSLLKVQAERFNCIEDGNNPEKSISTWEGGVNFILEA